jgi:hypothetical protein
MLISELRPHSPQGKNVIYRGNFFDYVRVVIKPPHQVFRPSVNIDGDGIPQDIDKMGSVCSPKQPWLTRMWIVESEGAYVKKTGNDQNELPIRNFINHGSHVPLSTP